MYCKDCNIVDMTEEATMCNDCDKELENIGFVEVTKTVQARFHIGGRLERGFCNCGKPAMLKGHDSKGRKTYRSQCSACRYAAMKYPVTHCEACGVESTGKGTIHRDHIDGDRSNNCFNNLQALCKDCHQQKTSVEAKAGLYRKVKA
jgi:hypothetical protein